MEQFPDTEIHRLTCKPALSRQKIALDNLIGFLTDAPFGIPALISDLKNLEKEYYLIRQGGQQFLAVVTDELFESRKLLEPVLEKAFQIGDLLFTDCGPLPR